MAPSPVLNIEPKGPDKNDEKCIESVPPKDKQNMPKSVNDNVTSKEKISVDQLRLDEIEDAGLKSLLDEAYSYKSPKDRLGKSNLFQVLLNEVEENDAGKKKKLSERSNSFADGRSNASASAVGNGHDTAQDKAFLNNILGACEKDKKKKNKKRDGSSASSGSRRPKFSHSLKINHGPQSSSHAYNGSNTGSATNVYNGGSRSLSRVQQPFASRISNTKTAALLTTSSSNIDIPMVTTYNKQPIMTPALVPSTQKSSPDVITLESSDENGKSVADDTGTAAAIALSPKSPAGEKELDAIEMKILESKGGDRGSVFNYTTHASLEIGNGGAVDGGAKPGDDYDKEDAENVAPTVVFPFQQSLGGLMNGNSADRSSTRCSTTDCPKSVNGLSDSEKLEDADNAVSSSNNNTVMKHVENEEDEDAKKNGHHHHQHDVHNDEKQAPRSDYINDNNVGASLYAASVDEPKTLTSLLAKSAAAQNSANNSAFKYHAEPSYSPYPWHVPNLIVTLTGDSMAATLGRNYCTKESLESRRLCDENTNTLNSSYPYFGNNSTSMNRERLDNGSERKHKSRKPKKQNTTSVLAENIEGYCGDKSVEYLVDYIENTKPGGEGGPKGGSVKSGKPSTSATRSSAGAKNNSRASTDDEVRSKKPNKTKERLKKSTSLEDLRHNKSHKQAPNKKQSSMDDSDLAKTMSDEVAPADTPERRSNETKTLSDDSSHLYYDSVDHVDDDNYTETDFHLVTKKQRKKKRRSKSRSATLEQKGSLSQNFLPHNYTDRNDNGNFKRSTRSTENRHRSRRKSVSSVVPSDKISDSDSIHSLPVSSTTPKCKMKKKSTSSGCTPQASYADIAKSPQCSSSTTLNGDAGKWHSSLKTFSNSPPSAYSTTTQNTTASSFGSSTSASSSNTGDTPEHSDNSELVSGAVVRSRKSDHSNVGSDHSCDQLSFANDDNSFNEHPPPSVHSSVDCVDEKDSGCSVNDSSAGSASTECGIEVTLKRKPNKSSGGGKNAENDTNNNTPNANLSNGVDNKTPKDYHSNASSNSSTVCNNSTNSHNVNHNNSSNIINNINNNINNNNNNNNNNINNNNNNINNNNNNNNNTNANATKIKKSRNKKNKNINNNVDDNDINDNHDVNCCKNDKATKNVADGVGEELFIEFTLKCAPAATTKSSETQTDSETVEVNNNACNRYHHRNNSNGCNDVTVEQTIVLSCNRSNGVAFDGSQSQTSVDKLSHSLPINNETGKTVLLLNDNNSRNNSAPSEINVEFDATEQSLEDATKERQSEIQKEIVERSAKYNVTEVIQYVNKNWNEVVKNLASSKVANANKKVQYYAGK